MSKIININKVQEYNDFVGAKTLHPLVNVIDFSLLPPICYVNTKKLFGLYAIYLRDSKFTELGYGQSVYDYQEGTLVFAAPGQVMGSEEDGKYHKVKGYLLLFHPDLLQNTPLEHIMKNYSYFSYNVKEALHLSSIEREIVVNCFSKIYNEIENADSCSKDLIVDYIKLFLDYCTRFYKRQFSSRKEENGDVLMRLESFLNNYFNSNTPFEKGIPTVQMCADNLCLSANYLSDLIKQETGLSALKHIHRKTLEMAKEMLWNTDNTINEIATGLGFLYPQHFSRWFKKMEGCTPNEYRMKLKN
jgi:AraC-like DNA-binding protein